MVVRMRSSGTPLRSYFTNILWVGQLRIFPLPPRDANRTVRPGALITSTPVTSEAMRPVQLPSCIVAG